MKLSLWLLKWFFFFFLWKVWGFFNTSQACWNKSSKRPAVNLLLLSFREPVLRARWRGSGLSIFGFEEKRQKEKHRQTKMFLRMFFYFTFIPHETQPGTDSVNWLLLKKIVFYMYNCQVGQNQLSEWSLIIFRKHAKTHVGSGGGGWLIRPLPAASVSATFPFYLEQLQACSSSYNNSIMGWQQSSHKSLPWQINNPLSPEL